MEPGLTLAGPFGVATVAEPIGRVEEPYSLERRMRIWAPPIDTRTRSRTVWSSMFRSGSCRSGAADCGLAAQVSIHASPGAAARGGRNASWGPNRRRQTRAQL